MQPAQHLLFMLCSCPSALDDLSDFYTTTTPESAPFCVRSQDSQELNIKAVNVEKNLVCAVVPMHWLTPNCSCINRDNLQNFGSQFIKLF